MLTIDAMMLWTLLCGLAWTILAAVFASAATSAVKAWLPALEPGSAAAGRRKAWLTLLPIAWGLLVSLPIVLTAIAAQTPHWYWAWGWCAFGGLQASLVVKFTRWVLRGLAGMIPAMAGGGYYAATGPVMGPGAGAPPGEFGAAPWGEQAANDADFARGLPPEAGGGHEG